MVGSEESPPAPQCLLAHLSSTHAHTTHSVLYSTKRTGPKSILTNIPHAVIGHNNFHIHQKAWLASNSVQLTSSLALAESKIAAQCGTRLGFCTIHSLGFKAVQASTTFADRGRCGAKFIEFVFNVRRRSIVEHKDFIAKEVLKKTILKSQYP